MYGLFLLHLIMTFEYTDIVVSYYSQRSLRREGIMTLKRILTAGMFVLIISSPALAQTSSEGSLTVTTNPPGALVTLTGEVVVSGVTPAIFRQTLAGLYKIELSRPGYEKYSSRLFLDPARVSSLDVSLSRKTRLKSLARSIIIPGWGQRYSDQKLKGTLLTTAAIGSVIAYFLVNDNFNEKMDIYKDKVSEYDFILRNGNYGDLALKHAELVDAQDEAYDAENKRRFAIGTVIGIWGINLLDALFFFPSYDGSFNVHGLSISPQTDNGQVGLTISRAF